MSMAIDQFVGQAGERRPIGLVAGVGVVAQRDVEVGRHQQGQSDDPQGGAAFFALAAPGQGAPFVEGVDEGEEVGGVEEDPADIDGEAGGPGGRSGRVRWRWMAWGETRAMWSQKRWLVSCWGRTVQEASQRGALEPAGDLDLAAGSDAAVEGGEEQVGADGGSGAAPCGTWRSMCSISCSASGEVVQGHDGAEVGDDRLLGGAVVGCVVGWSQGGDDVVGAAEILLPDDLGLAVDAAAFRSHNINPARKMVREHEDLVVSGGVTIVTGRERSRVRCGVGR